MECWILRALYQTAIAILLVSLGRNSRLMDLTCLSSESGVECIWKDRIDTSPYIEHASATAGDG